jgi:hypothetical protein
MMFDLTGWAWRLRRLVLPLALAAPVAEAGGQIPGARRPADRLPGIPEHLIREWRVIDPILVRDGDGRVERAWRVEVTTRGGVDTIPGVRTLQWPAPLEGVALVGIAYDGVQPTHSFRYDARTRRTERRPLPSLDELKRAPTEIQVGGARVHLNGYAWLNLTPGLGLEEEQAAEATGERGSPLHVLLAVAPADTVALPTGTQIDIAWLLWGDQAEPVPLTDFHTEGHELPPGAEMRRIWGGPSWVMAADSLNVVVRITEAKDTVHYLQAPAVELIRVG